jgi:hypothetical protein
MKKKRYYQYHRVRTCLTFWCLLSDPAPHSLAPSKQTKAKGAERAEGGNSHLSLSLSLSLTPPPGGIFHLVLSAHMSEGSSHRIHGRAHGARVWKFVVLTSCPCPCLSLLLQLLTLQPTRLPPLHLTPNSYWFAIISSPTSSSLLFISVFWKGC